MSENQRRWWWSSSSSSEETRWNIHLLQPHIGTAAWLDSGGQRSTELVGQQVPEAAAAQSSRASWEARVHDSTTSTTSSATAASLILLHDVNCEQDMMSPGIFDHLTCSPALNYPWCCCCCYELLHLDVYCLYWSPIMFSWATQRWRPRQEI